MAERPNRKPPRLGHRKEKIPMPSAMSFFNVATIFISGTMFQKTCRKLHGG